MKTNHTLTARPQIFFRVSREAHPSDDLIRKMHLELPADEKEFTDAYLTLGTREYREMQSATNEDDRATLQALKLLQRARTANTSTAKDLYDAALLLAPGIAQLLKHPDKRRRFDRTVFSSSEWQKSINRFYPTLLSTEMRERTHLGVSSDFVPAIYCDDLRTAVFVYAAYRGIAVCLGCRKLFAADPEEKQKYHSAACGQRVWQKEYRLREKKKLAVKKSKRAKKRNGGSSNGRLQTR